MRLFLDTEYTDPEHQQLISIGIISEDGQRSFYGELNDYDESLCNRFVRESVLPHLDHQGMSREQLAHVLCEWFATLPRRVFFSCDSYDDIKLVMTLLGERPANLIENWLDLRSLIDTSIYHNAVEVYHTPDKPWHHALHDATAHRAGWLAWMDHNKIVPINSISKEPLVVDVLDQLVSMMPEYFQAGRPEHSHLPAAWLSLITEMMDELSRIRPDCQIDQVKEKFGVLTLSINDRSDDVLAIFDKYIQHSSAICIVCGKPLHYSEEEKRAVLQLFKCAVCSDCKPKFRNRTLYG